MAKRFNVSIPDALAERLEPHKDKISLSAVMQAALERELAQLTMGDQEKQRRESFKAAAMSAWLKRNPVYTKVIHAFVDHLFDKAVNDGLGDFFDFYRDLSVCSGRDELIERISKSFYYKDCFGGYCVDEEKWKEKIGRALGTVISADEEYIGTKIIHFVREECKNSSELINFGPHYPVDDAGLPPDNDPFWFALCSPSALSVILQVMKERVKSLLSQEEIDSLILNFDDEFVEVEFQEAQES
jgi:hypothetical protein